MPTVPSLPATQIQPIASALRSNIAPGQLQGDALLDGAITAAVYPPQNGDVAALPRLSDAVMPQDDARYTWTKDLLNFPAVLVWGAQGSGKTSFTAWLLRERIRAGHTAEVWDVHREFGQWNGLPVFGDGMDYEAIDRRMLAFEKQVKADYQKRATDPKYSPKRHTVICEEFTNFARRCEHSAPFLEASLSDLRKVRKGVIFVSHGRSLSTLGGSQGFAQTRNSGLLELQLEAKIDPATGDPMPAMKGKLKIPGKAAIEVEIAPWMNGAMNFSDVAQSDATLPTATSEQELTRAKLEELYQGETTEETVTNLGNDGNDAETKSLPDVTMQPQSFEPIAFSTETVAKRFPETTETALFEAILSGYRNGSPPNEIVKQSLKLGKDRYQEGRSLCCYLIRRYGNVELLLHFRKWIDQ